MIIYYHRNIMEKSKILTLLIYFHGMLFCINNNYDTQVTNERLTHKLSPMSGESKINKMCKSDSC